MLPSVKNPRHGGTLIMIDRKIYRLSFLVLFMVVFSLHLYSWEYNESSFDFEGRTAMMATAGQWNPYIKLKGIFYGDEQEILYSSITAGTYFKAADWLKVGAFYRLQMGTRHLDDWQFDTGPPDTHWWNDTSDRLEHLMYFDATPRFLLPFTPMDLISLFLAILMIG